MAYAYKRGARWYVGFKDETGRARQISTSARTKTEAEKLAGELERKAERVRLGLDVAVPADLPLTEGVAQYLASLPPGYRSKSDLEARFRTRILPHLSGRTVRSVTPADVKRVIAANADCSPQTREHLRVAMQGAFTFFIRGLRVYFEQNPAGARQVGKVRVPEHEPRYLSADDVARLLAKIPKQWRALCELAVGTGMRKGELLGLHRADVKLDEGRIVVRRSHDSATTKGGKERVVYIADWFRETLERQLEASRGSQFLFPDPSGKAWRFDVKLNAIVRRALVRAGLTDGFEHRCRACRWKSERVETAEPAQCPTCGETALTRPRALDFRFKDLRSTWATHAFRATKNIRFVQQGLGHSDPRLTAGRYIRVLDADQKEQSNRVQFTAVSHPQEKGDE